MSDDARAYALRLLGQRSYTTHNLRRKLLHKEFPAAEVEATLERLTETGLLDDSRFALSFARSKLTGAGASKRRVKQTLARKGIPGTVADIAIDQVIADEDIDTSASLERVAKKKLASYGELEPHVLRRRMYGFLARRGYDVDEIRSVVDRLMKATESEL